MIPGEIFTSFAKFQRIVSVNGFRLPNWLQELLQAPLCFLRNFCFARIRLDPLGGQVLHHDCISVIVSRFTVVTQNFVICCYQVTKIFSTRYGSANASSARCPCNFCPLADPAMSVFGELRKKHCAYPNPHVSCMWALKIVYEKSWSESLHVQEVHHPPNFPIILAATPGFQNLTGLSVPWTTCLSVLSVFFSFVFGFCWLDQRWVSPIFRQP